MVGAAHEVEPRRRRGVTRCAAPAETVQHLRTTAAEDPSSLRRDVEREELPVVGRGTETRSSLHHRLLWHELEDGSDRVTTAFGRPGDRERLRQMTAHVVDEVVSDARHQVDVLERVGVEPRVLDHTRGRRGRRRCGGRMGTGRATSARDEQRRREHQRIVSGAVDPARARRTMSTARA